MEISNPKKDHFHQPLPTLQRAWTLGIGFQGQEQMGRDMPLNILRYILCL